MDNRTRRNNGLVYRGDEETLKEIKRARRLLQKLNTVDRADFGRIEKILKELLGKCDRVFLMPPFYCDYGFNISLGKNCFINFNCTILDVAPVTIGDNCQIAPNVAIYTAGHPVHPETRNTGYEYGIKINIGNNVWIGGNSVICPGVTIGDNVVIGAGSVVTKDIPNMVIAAGNPCKELRKITEEDKRYYFKDRMIDEEAWENILKINPNI